LRYTELIILLQGNFWLRSLIQIKLGLMAFFGVYAIGMMPLRNTSDCQPMSLMGHQRILARDPNRRPGGGKKAVM
jgi:hypothetical protein